MENTKWSDNCILVDRTKGCHLKQNARMIGDIYCDICKKGIEILVTKKYLKAKNTNCNYLVVHGGGSF